MIHQCLLLDYRNELKDVTEWRKLEFQLSFSKAILDEVEHNNHDLANMKSSMLDRWLKINPEASWKDSIERYE